MNIREIINNQLNQLGNDNLEEVSNYIEEQLGVAFSSKNKMYKAIEKICIETCPWVKDNIYESDSFFTLRLESGDIKNIVDEMEVVFCIEPIELSDVMEWQRVSDIVNYILNLKRNK